MKIEIIAVTVICFRLNLMALLLFMHYVLDMHILFFRKCEMNITLNRGILNLTFNFSSLKTLEELLLSLLCPICKSDVLVKVFFYVTDNML